MDVISSIKSIHFLHGLLTGERENLLNYAFTPQKPQFAPKQQIAPLPRTTPEAVGISSKHLNAFYQELCCKKGVNAHSIILMKDGKIFSEGSFAPYRSDVWHVTHSMCKSITSMAIGLLINEGKISLDDKVFNLLKSKALTVTSPTAKKISIENLLCMSSGIDYRELAIIADEDWLKGFFKGRVDFEPGTHFAYNSMNSYLLSCVVKAVTGQGLVDYLAPRLFEPLGITNFAWEKSAFDIEKGGWGLYITLEDMAKLGQLMLQKGKWLVNGEEKQILPQQYVEQSTSTHMELKDERNDLEYGYHFWTRKSDGMFQFNGMLGQYVFVIPRHNIVIAMNSGCCNLANHSYALDCFDKYFANVEEFSSKSITQNVMEYQKLKRGTKNLQYEKPFDNARKTFASWYQTNVMQKTFDNKISPLAPHIDGLRYTVHDNPVGLLPLILQCMNNNMGTGVQKISFEIKDDVLQVLWKESDKTFIIPVVDGISKEFLFDYNGEKFLASTISKMLINEDDYLVLKITICLLESSCARKIKFIFDENKLTILMDEDPNIDKVISSFTLAENWQLDLLELKDKRYAKYRLAQILTPTLEAQLEK